MAAVAEKIAEAQSGLGATDQRKKLQQLSMFDSFRELDWKPVALEVEALAKEKQLLEEGSDVLRTLHLQLHTGGNLDCQDAGELNVEIGKQSVTLDRIKSANDLLSDCTAQISAVRDEDRAKHFPRLDKMLAKNDERLTVETCDARQHETRETLQSDIRPKERSPEALRDRIVETMKGYSIVSVAHP